MEEKTGSLVDASSMLPTRADLSRGTGSGIWNLLSLSPDSCYGVGSAAAVPSTGAHKDILHILTGPLNVPAIFSR